MLIKVCSAQIEINEGHEFYSLNPYVSVYLNNDLNPEVQHTSIDHFGGLFPHWND